MPHQCYCTLDDQELEALNWGGFREASHLHKVSFKFVIYYL